MFSACCLRQRPMQLTGGALHAFRLVAASHLYPPLFEEEPILLFNSDKRRRHYRLRQRNFASIATPSHLPDKPPLEKQQQQLSLSPPPQATPPQDSSLSPLDLFRIKMEELEKTQRQSKPRSVHKLGYTSSAAGSAALTDVSKSPASKVKVLKQTNRTSYQYPPVLGIRAREEESKKDEGQTEQQLQQQFLENLAFYRASVTLPQLQYSAAAADHVPHHRHHHQEQQQQYQREQPSLSSQQQQVLDLMKQGENVFLTGKVNHKPLGQNFKIHLSSSSSRPVPEKQKYCVNLSVIAVTGIRKYRFLLQREYLLLTLGDKLSIRLVALCQSMSTI